jgi:hypothetical protein
VFVETRCIASLRGLGLAGVTIKWPRRDSGRKYSTPKSPLFGQANDLFEPSPSPKFFVPEAPNFISRSLQTVPEVPNFFPGASKLFRRRQIFFPEPPNCSGGAKFFSRRLQTVPEALNFFLRSLQTAPEAPVFFPRSHSDSETGPARLFVFSVSKDYICGN